MSPTEILEKVSQRLTGKSPQIDDILRELMNDCGHEVGDLTLDDFSLALRGIADLPWREIQFACVECIAAYSTVQVVSEKQVLQIIAAICILGNCCEHGYKDTDFAFDHVLNLVTKLQGWCDDYVRGRVLKIYLNCTY